MESSLKDRVIELLKRNRRVKNNHQYTVPSPTTYPYQWLWDSCFHAIILSHFNLEDAKKEILSLISAQFENGMIPHMVYWQKATTIDFDWGKQGTSSITQPPMLAYAVWRIFERDHDVEFLNKVYRSFFHYYKYLVNERDPHERHLIGIINPDESGEDNSPRFDKLLNLPPIHSLAENLNRRLDLVKENKTCKFDAPFCMKNFFWVKDVPFNAILVENLDALAKIADKLDRTYDAKYFRRERQTIINSMNELMLEDGVYYSTFGEDYQKIKVKTWAIFSPLFARMLGPEEAKKLVQEHLLSTKEFWLKYKVPTVAATEPSFNSKGFWRGPIWFASNWFIYKGLKSYGFDNEAAEIKKSTEEILHKGGFREYFDPHTGEGYGAKEFTWGGLILDMD